MEGKGAAAAGGWELGMCSGVFPPRDGPKKPPHLTHTHVDRGREDMVSLKTYTGMWKQWTGQVAAGGGVAGRCALDSGGSDECDARRCCRPAI